MHSPLPFKNPQFCNTEMTTDSIWVHLLPILFYSRFLKITLFTFGCAEAPILWPPDVKNWLIGKDHDAGKDWRQEEKGMAEDEMVEWHHQFDTHEFQQAPRVGGQGSLTCCSPWGRKESDTTEWLNWTVQITMKEYKIVWSLLSTKLTLIGKARLSMKQSE